MIYSILTHLSSPDYNNVFVPHDGCPQGLLEESCETHVRREVQGVRGGASLRRALWLAGLIGALSVIGCSRAPAKSARQAEPSEAALPVAKEEAEAFALASYTDDGRKRWEVLGKTANLAAEMIDMTEITATTYGDETGVTLTAREGTFDRRARNVHLQRDVKAVTTEGTTLTTQSLDWDAERQVATTEEWTTVQRANLTVQGQGAVGTPSLKQVRFHKRVQVDVEPATKITCTGPLEVDYARHRARFWRQVHVQDQRGEIWADRMDVQMDPKTQQLSQVQCWGHVQIRQRAQLARARRALYRQQDGRIVLIGHPQVTLYTEEGEPGERPAAP